MTASLIVFTNPGEIDIVSMTSFGVSVKEGDNPIGFFGTGLKYAIAVLLRNEHEITVHAGATEVRFVLLRQQVRGKDFDFVGMSVNDAQPIQLGFTTELGKNWEMWMAYREIACNCKDEGGSITQANGAPYPRAGETHIVVRGGEFSESYANRHRFILEDAAAFSVGDVEVRARRGSDFYYRGVRVHDIGQHGLFTYNNTGRMQLTEDRTLKEQYEASQCVRRSIMRADNEEFIRTCVTASDKTLEGGMDYHGWGIAPSETFLRVVGECRAQRINATALKVWRDATKQTIEPDEVGLTKVQIKSLEKALDFCATIGFQIRGAYPIKFCESLGEGGLGLAQNGTIYIAERVFHLGGTKQLASTLIEEYLHLRHGWKDMTRELQSFLFDKMVSLGEELAGEPL